MSSSAYRNILSVVDNNDTIITNFKYIQLVHPALGQSVFVVFLVVFSCIRTEYGVSLHIQQKCRKIHARETANTDTSQPAFTCSKLTIETLEQRFEICSKLTIKPPKRRKLTIKPPKRRQRRLFGGFVNFEHISNLYSSVSIVNFEYVIAGWVLTQCRSSHMELFFKKGVLKSLTKSSIKHPCWSLFFNIVSFLKRKL